jgi:hypothetical protein
MLLLLEKEEICGYADDGVQDNKNGAPLQQERRSEK